MRHHRSHTARRFAGADLVVLTSRGPAGLRSQRRSSLTKLPPAPIRIALLSAFLVGYGQVASWSSLSPIRNDAPASALGLASAVPAPAPRAGERMDTVAQSVKTTALARGAEGAGESLFAGRSCRAQSYIVGDRTVTVHKC